MLTSSGWRCNFTGGRAIEVTLRGERRPAYAVLTADPREVAAIYERLIRDVGMKQARLGLRFNVDRCADVIGVAGRYSAVWALDRTSS